MDQPGSSLQIPVLRGLILQRRASFGLKVVRVQVFPAPDGPRSLFRLGQMTALGELQRDGQDLSCANGGWQEAQGAKCTSISSELACRNQLLPLVACLYFQTGIFLCPGVGWNRFSQPKTHSYTTTLRRHPLNTSPAFETLLFREGAAVWMVGSWVYWYSLE